jgi:hypothetical protein
MKKKNLFKISNDKILFPFNFILKLFIRHGKGKYIWKNQDVYEGDFKEGLRHGKGIKIF